MEENTGLSKSTNFRLLANKLGISDKYEKYLEYIFGNKNVSLDNGYVCYEEENEKIAEIIPKDKIVIDVGCSFGLQHLLYKDHKFYVGIQKFVDGHNAWDGFKPMFRTFTDNSIILEGWFRDFAPMLEPFIRGREDQFFGIAYSSIWNAPQANDDDIRWFKRLFPKNYFASETGKRIYYES
jgi:hypothetical protein